MSLAPSADELRRAYCGKRVLVTGHTGFKGGWLTLWLSELGASVTGYALAPDTTPALFDAARVGSRCTSVIADVRDRERLRSVVRELRPQVVFHLAAQPLVRRSYEQPIETIHTNVLGTAHLLDALRVERVRSAVVIVTSDKCYENREWPFAYRERDRLGGHDVYSMSKAATELVASSYRDSFFPPAALASHGVAIATARAGNVIGGGDWAQDRIIPDAVTALSRGHAVPVRNPASVRPWQHVLEPLSGYLLLGAKLAGTGTDEPARFCEAWNFGPSARDCLPVGALVDEVIAAWGSGAWDDRHDPCAPHEAGRLVLAIDKAQDILGWTPRWRLREAVRATIDWYQAARAGSGSDLQAKCLDQIRAYLRA